MPSYRILLLFIFTTWSYLGVGQRQVVFAVGMTSSRHAVQVVPPDFQVEFVSPNGKLGSYAEASIDLTRRGAWASSVVTRVALEGTNSSRSWPEISSLRASLGTRIQYEPTSIVGVLAGLSAAATLRETFAGQPLPLTSAPERNHLDARAELGLVGHFNRFQVSMILERGLAFKSRNVLLYESPERQSSFVPNYYTGTMRFGIGYVLTDYKDVVPDTSP